MSFRLRPLACAAVASLALPASAASLEVLHWWTNAGDSRAIKVVADGLTARGDKWIDTAIAGGPGPGLQVTMSRMAAGDPPGAVQMPLGVRVRDVAAEKLLGDITEVSVKGRWHEVLPQPVLRGVSFGGKVVAVPITMHGANWMWFNRKVLERAKVGVPGNWDEVMAAAEKIKAAGLLPFAVSSQPWQVNWLYGNILAGVGGRAAYEQFASGNKAVFHTPAGQKSLEILAQIRRYADDASANRTWIASANLLVQEKAAFQFMGDWAKNEFKSAGKPAAPSGSEIGCALTPGTGDRYLMLGDVLAVPAAVKGDTPAAQKRLAEVAMDPKVQVQVALAKGSLPFRSDVKLEGFDDCAKFGQKVFTAPNGAVPSSAMLMTNEVNGAITDTLAKYWARPDMGTKAAADQLAAAVQRAQ